MYMVCTLYIYGIQDTTLDTDPDTCTKCMYCKSNADTSVIRHKKPISLGK